MSSHGNRLDTNISNSDWARDIIVTWLFNVTWPSECLSRDQSTRALCSESSVSWPAAKILAVLSVLFAIAVSRIRFSVCRDTGCCSDAGCRLVPLTSQIVMMSWWSWRPELTLESRSQIRWTVGQNDARIYSFGNQNFELVPILVISVQCCTLVCFEINLSPV